MVAGKLSLALEAAKRSRAYTTVPRGSPLTAKTHCGWPFAENN